MLQNIAIIPSWRRPEMSSGLRIYDEPPSPRGAAICLGPRGEIRPASFTYFLIEMALVKETDRGAQPGFSRRNYDSKSQFGMDLNYLGSMLELMDADEREISLYLKGFPGQFVSYAEISHRAGGKRRYRQEPEWATNVLARMVEKGILESDSTGHYRLKTRVRKETTSRWVSPQIRRILEASGKSFDGVFEVDKDDDETDPR